MTGTLTRAASRFPTSWGGGTVQVWTDSEYKSLTGIDPGAGGSGAEVYQYVNFINGDYGAQPYELSSTLYIKNQGWCAVFKNPLKQNSDVRINYIIVIA